MQEISQSLGPKTIVTGTGTPCKKPGSKIFNPYITIDCWLLLYIYIEIGPNLGFNCSDVFIDAAELLNVCWLEVHGKFETANLSPGTLYEVAFVVKLNAADYGWEVPVNFRLTLPDGTRQCRKVNLMQTPRGQWVEIPVGEFKASPEKSGDMEFSMYEYDGGNWKKGLVIKGVVIRPKNQVAQYSATSLTS